MSSGDDESYFSLERVHKCLEEGKPIRALGHLLVLVNLEPRLKEELCPIVLSVLSILSGTLAAERRYEDLLKCYREILGVYSDNEIVLNNIGSQLYRFSHRKESRMYFKLACDINDNYLPAFRNLQNVSNVLVERWHFRMLNDALRNETYRKAISKRVGQNSPTVIDIGTGTGLLSLYINSSGAEYICACDYSSVMSSIAQDVFLANLPENTINVVNKLSSDMKIPDDLPFRCSLVVTETMDSGLLGEHLLTTLDHAWDHLLLPSSSTVPRVIPAGARLFAVPIESLRIARKNQLLRGKRLSSENNLSHDLDWSDLAVYSIKNEPYDTENLFIDPCCRYLAEPVELYRFDFNNPLEIKQYLQRNLSKSTNLVCNSGGYVDAIAVWFEADLDEELTITTSPLSPNHCSSWHHAIFPCHPSYEVSPKNELKLTSKCFEGVLCVNVNAIDNPSANVISLSEPIIKFLNCTTYLSTLDKSIRRVIENQLPVNRVIDMSSFPHQGLNLSKNGSKLMVVNDLLQPRILKKLVKRNKIKSSNVTCKTFCDVDTSCGIDEDEKYDLLIVNFVESRGEISQDFVKMAEELISKFLKPTSIIIPSKTEIWGRLICSDQLVNESRVTNPQLNDEYQLSQFINEYQVSTHLDVCIHDLKYTPLSDEFLIASIPTSMMYVKYNLPWDVNVPCTKSGSLNSVLCWFNIILYDDISYSTSSTDSFTSQAAEILPFDIPVSPTDTVIVKCLYNYGVVKVNVSKV